ncbi:MAG: hypothetical protein GTO67_11470 [Gammaproteobacteria bacterium]|nr:hypothetical protein [Gammaproteobacteria bacterium]NIM74791.1 hypothetical protein [Gammaproteobacteria bacterium]NIN39222.1 hypothetical protein [Gammaproteobacteria bacterium]NIO26708.1 hypothetical protein [Gammaproteobacteria bacterium]NIO67264.1 hypothetical protein [Gammaproteobacteria bacterium]
MSGFIELPLAPDESSAASSILSQDYVDESKLETRFGPRDRDAPANLLGRLEACSVLDRI